MQRRLGIVGALVLGGGLFGAVSEDSAHNACNSGLGQFGQALSASAASSCGVDNTLFYVAVLATIVGLALILAVMLFRS